MERALKWALPLLIIADVALVWSGVLEAGTALLVGVLVEGMLALVGLRQLIMALRRYRVDRSAGLDMEASLEAGLTVLVPPRVARLIALEPRLWVYLFRWLFRRRPLAAEEFSYLKRSSLSALLAVALLTAPLEIFAIELLVPWPFVRWLLLALGIYSIIWLLAYYASLKVLPHRLAPDGIHLYYGVTAHGYIPYAQIEGVRLERRNTRGHQEGLKVAPKEGIAYLATGGRTDITFCLNSPATFRTLLSSTPEVTTVCISADNPPEFARHIEQRLALHSPTNTPLALLQA